MPTKKPTKKELEARLILRAQLPGIVEEILGGNAGAKKTLQQMFENVTKDQEKTKQKAQAFIVNNGFHGVLTEAFVAESIRNAVEKAKKSDSQSQESRIPKSIQRKPKELFEYVGTKVYSEPQLQRQISSLKAEARPLLEERKDIHKMLDARGPSSHYDGWDGPARIISQFSEEYRILDQRLDEIAVELKPIETELKQKQAELKNLGQEYGRGLKTEAAKKINKGKEMLYGKAEAVKGKMKSLASRKKAEEITPYDDGAKKRKRLDS